MSRQQWMNRRLHNSASLLNCFPLSSLHAALWWIQKEKLNWSYISTCFPERPHDKYDSWLYLAMIYVVETGTAWVGSSVTSVSDKINWVINKTMLQLHSSLLYQATLWTITPFLFSNCHHSHSRLKRRISKRRTRNRKIIRLLFLRRWMIKKKKRERKEDDDAESFLWLWQWCILFKSNQWSPQVYRTNAKKVG